MCAKEKPQELESGETHNEYKIFSQLKEKIVTTISNKDMKVDELCTSLDAIYTSKEFSIQQLQTYLPIVVADIQKDETAVTICKMPFRIKKKLSIAIEQGSMITKQEKEETKQEKEETKQEKEETKQEKEETKQEKEETKQEKEEKGEEKDLKIEQLKIGLGDLKFQYPQYAKDTINLGPGHPYYEQNKHIFDATTLQTRKDQQPILEYKYIIEQINQEAQKKGFFTEKEATYINSYNSFCRDLSINDTIKIDLPIHPTESIASIRDVIDNKQLGEHLYTNNQNIKSYIDKQTESSIQPMKFDNKTIVQNLPELFPDRIINDFQSLCIQNKISRPTNFQRNNLIQDGSINKTYLEQITGEKSQMITQSMSQIITQYSEQAQNMINQQTSLRLNQHTLGVCLQTVASYLDTVTLNLEDFAKDTKLNAQDITIDEKTNVATIHGTTKGKNITIFYNLNTGAILSQDFISANTGVVFVGDNKGQQETLDFTGPRYTDIQKNASNRSTKNINQYITKGSLSDIDKTYTHDLQRTITPKANEILGRDIMEHTIEKNIATKQIQGLIQQGLPSAGNRNKNIQPEIRKLYTIFDKSMDRYSPNEIRQLRGSIAEMTTIVNTISQKSESNQPTGVDPIRAFLFILDHPPRSTAGWVGEVYTAPSAET